MALIETITDNRHYFTDENGDRQGEFKRWYETGQPWAYCFYKDGRLHGESKAWYANGQLRKRCFYKDDRLHGEFKAWYDNGQLCAHYFYKDDKLHGELKAWYEDGTLYCWTYDVNDELVINFRENPELYPLTDESRTFFSLKYGSSRLLPMEEPHAAN